MIIRLVLLIFFSVLYCDEKIIAQDRLPDDRFGKAVSISESWLAIGANRDDNANGSNVGSVYIYKYDDLNIIEEFHIIPPDGSPNDYFGKSLSIYNDWLVASSIYDDVNGEKSGSAYVYYFDGIDWIFHTKLLPADGNAFDRFGYSVDIYDDIIVIGSVYDDDMGEDSGSVYVYRLENNQWHLDTKLLSIDQEEGDFFGSALSVNSNIVAIGSIYDNIMGLNSGSVSLFQFDGDNWNEIDKITAFDGMPYDSFGSALDLSSNVLIVGSFHDNNLHQNSGSVYIYDISVSESFFLIDKITAFDEGPNDNFGQSVSIYENYFAVGSLNDDNGLNSGAVYLYDIIGQFDEIKYIPDDGSQYDEFGGAISLYNNTILVGSQYSDDSAGSAYIANIVGCPNDNACNYSNDLWASSFLCEYPINNFDCEGGCDQEIDECGVCGGTGVSGDVNYDSSINIVDIILIIEYILQSNIYHVNSCSVDINYSGIVNITDVIILLEFILLD
jgi:hypothetical protein